MYSTFRISLSWCPPKCRDELKYDFFYSFSERLWNDNGKIIKVVTAWDPKEMVQRVVQNIGNTIETLQGCGCPGGQDRRLKEFRFPDRKVFNRNDSNGCILRLNRALFVCIHQVETSPFQLCLFGHKFFVESVEF